MSRQADHPIDPRFVARWSPRAMSGEAVSRGEMLQLLEAGRWAPSAANHQPWRFVFAHRDTPAFDAFLKILNEGNRIWCERAGGFIAVLSKQTTADGRPNVFASFDAGAAWMSLALQGSQMGLVVHGMGGFDVQALRTLLELPEDVKIECVVALGRPGDVALLPEAVQARETPSGRRPVAELAFEARWGGV